MHEYYILRDELCQLYFFKFFKFGCLHKFEKTTTKSMV